MTTQQLRTFLESLTPRQRATEIFLRRDHMSIAQIAHELDIAPIDVARAFADAEIALAAYRRQIGDTPDTK